MAMGRRPKTRQRSMWIEASSLNGGGGHPFYERLNRLLEEHGFDEAAERSCARFYASTMGRPSLPPTVYFRLLLIGYFEGIDSERGIAWRVADSISLRSFLGYELSDSPPDHSTFSRTRRLIDLETHEAVFGKVLQVLAKEGLLKGKTLGIDATTLEANAGGAALLGGAANAVQFVATELVNSRDVSLVGVALSAATGAVAGAVAGPVSRATGLSFNEGSVIMSGANRAVGKAVNEGADAAVALSVSSLARSAAASMISNPNPDPAATVDLLEKAVEDPYQPR